MIIYWDRLLGILRRPILGRMLVLLGSVLFGTILGFIGAIASDLVHPLSSVQFKVAVGGFALMGLIYGIALIARR